MKIVNRSYNFFVYFKIKCLLIVLVLLLIWNNYIRGNIIVYYFIIGLLLKK